MQLKFKVDDRQIERIFGDFKRKQLPFALALTATKLAKGVQAAERAEVEHLFDKPTPFTMNAFATLPATKAKPTATVLTKDVQAAYLLPYVKKGKHFLGTKKGLLVPKGVAVNQYGNLTRGKLKALLAKPGVFVGAVKGKDGQTINGVWQRQVVSAGAIRGGVRGSRRHARAASDIPRGGLKLLIRFEDPLQVRQTFDFFGIAETFVCRNAPGEFARAFAKAMATAK